MTLLDKLKDFCTIFQPLLDKETIAELEREVDYLKDKRDFWQEACNKHKQEEERWKMRADERTEQYQYWMHIANQQHKLTVEEAFDYAKTLCNARKNNAEN